MPSVIDIYLLLYPNEASEIQFFLLNGTQQKIYLLLVPYPVLNLSITIKYNLGIDTFDQISTKNDTGCVRRKDLTVL